MSFPFLFGGTFIEGDSVALSLRRERAFPFLFGGTFIEGDTETPVDAAAVLFPFLLGGTFIEGGVHRGGLARRRYFLSFSEGLSLRLG